MRKSFLFFLLFLLTANLLAVPAKRQKKTLIMADGSKVEAVFCGDENIHYYASDDGRMFFLDAKGFAREVDAGKIRRLWHQRLNERGRRRQVRISNTYDDKNPVIGARKGLVILVNFLDREMTYPLAEYQDFFNKVGYSHFGMSGSVHDYFYAQSYGQFDLTFDVVGPVTVNKEYAYYGMNADEISGRDMHPAEMIGEAIAQADSLVDYSDYDWDKDGYVDQVFILYAGYGEAQAPEQPSLIWPHEWKLSSAYNNGDGKGRLQKDGVIIDTYACSSELRGEDGKNLDGIGTACHEFSHCLGLPDFYDTDESDGACFGMNLWSVMDAGVYGGKDFDGTTPTGFTSYERMFCGWLKPEKLIYSGKISNVPALSETPKAYILYNDGNRNEYYMFENRQNTSWDTYLPGHGMLVLHVDYDEDVWRFNEVNGDNSHPRMTIIPADNQYRRSQNLTLKDLAGDPYPGTSGNTELTDTSTPAALLYNRNVSGEKLMGQGVIDISEHNGLISFTFDDGTLAGTPEALEPENITDMGFTAVWTSVNRVDFYQISFMNETYDVEETSYTFTGLEPGVTYYYKVRAVYGDSFGEWSNVVSVELPTTTNIKDVNAEATCQIYDLQGRKVSGSRRGIYILNGRKFEKSF